MNTRLDEIAAGIYRISVYIPEADFMFNQFLVDGDEPLLFHTGPRRPSLIVSQTINQVRPVEELRWITFGHLEADECGAMNLFLAAAPHAQVAHGDRVRAQHRRSRRPGAAAPRQRGRDRYRRPSAPLPRHTARPTPGTPSTTTRAPAPYCAATCSPRLAKAWPWSTANWSAPPWLRRTCSRPPA